MASDGALGYTDALLILNLSCGCWLDTLSHSLCSRPNVMSVVLHIMRLAEIVIGSISACALGRWRTPCWTLESQLQEL